MNRFLDRPHALAIVLALLLAFAWGVAPQPARGGGVTPSNAWIDIYGMDSVYNGQPLPVGAVVAVYDPDGVKCGEFVVHAAGMFGVMPCYGDDPFTPEDEGARPGELLHFTINEKPAKAVAVSLNRAPASPDAPITWSQHGDRWQIRLEGPVSIPDHTLVQGLKAGWSECGIKVAWSTSYEQPKTKFIIQRSLSLNGPFGAISTSIEGYGAPWNYVYCDGEVIPGNAYAYRLRILPDDFFTAAVLSEGRRYPMFLPWLGR